MKIFVTKSGFLVIAYREPALCLFFLAGTAQRVFVGAVVDFTPDHFPALQAARFRLFVDHSTPGSGTQATVNEPQ